MGQAGHACKLGPHAAWEVAPGDRVGVRRLFYFCTQAGPTCLRPLHVVQVFDPVPIHP